MRKAAVQVCDVFL